MLLNNTPTFQGNGYSVALTSDFATQTLRDRSHLTDPTKLMSTYLAPGMRKLPSQLELQMLADIRNSSSSLATSTRAAQDANPMLGITNALGCVTASDHRTTTGY
jgi:large repetitive protein